MEKEKTTPSMAQIIQAKRRIHTALDKGERPSSGDVEMIGGQEQLISLLSSRSEMKEAISKLTDQEVRQVQEENSRDNPTILKEKESSGGTQRVSEAEEPKRKMSKAEKDYYDFIGQRLGPLMCFFLFLAFRDWQKASFYAFSPDETQKMAEPISKIGPKVEELFRTPKWVHTLVTTSDDTVTLLMVFANYFERTGILDIILSPFFKPTLEK